MHPKDGKESKIYFMVNGEMKPVSECVSLDDCADIVDKVESVWSNPEYFKGEITVKVSKKTCKQVKMLVCPRYYFNNWRKMHGLPLVRRK